MSLLDKYNDNTPSNWGATVGDRVVYVGSITQAHGLAWVIGVGGGRVSLHCDAVNGPIRNVRPQSFHHVAIREGDEELFDHIYTSRYADRVLF